MATAVKPVAREQSINTLAKAGFILSVVAIVLFGFGDILKFVGIDRSTPFLRTLSLPVLVAALCLSLVALRRQPRGLTVAGALLSGIVGVCWILFGLGIVGAKPQADLEGQKMSTERTASDAMNVIQRHRESTGALPNAGEGNKLIADKLDAWGEPIRYEGDGDDYTLRSAGPDKKLNTQDDLTWKGGEKKIETELRIEGGFDGGPVEIPDDPKPADGKAKPEDGKSPGSDGKTT